MTKSQDKSSVVTSIALMVGVVTVIATSASYFGLLDSQAIGKPVITSIEANAPVAPVIPDAVQSPVPVAMPGNQNPPLYKNLSEDDKDKAAISKMIGNMQKDLESLRGDIAQVSSRVDELKTKIESGKAKTASVTVSDGNKVATVQAKKPKEESSKKGEFSILGASSTQLVISAGGETKKVLVGSALPNGAVFQGFDGKQIQTNMGVYLVE